MIPKNLEASVFPLNPLIRHVTKKLEFKKRIYQKVESIICKW
jgi:hypothetical protein